ncbi:endocuticle structural glycoprotein ABD-4-like [Planococcus citri]|uniref:endocuticle structural glycoprotein ABD-4-like n=1 Tax=Planococcus citri TaxID=170843 RepID=UPI0031FA2D0A
MNMQIAIVSALFAVVAAAPQEYYSTPIPILSQKQEISPDGSYYYSYQTGNGIAVDERSQYRALGPEEGTQDVQGYYAYTGPDGVQYAVSYTSGENGFIASGAHLPTPPPLPAELAKAFAEAPKDDGQYDERGFPIGPSARPFGRR